MNNLNFLKKHFLFQGVSSNFIEENSSFIEEKKYQKGEMIFREGSMLTCFYIVKNGEIEIAGNDWDGNKNIINIVKDNDIFGESIAISDNKIAPYSTMCLKDAIIYSISNRIVEQKNTLDNKFLINTTKLLSNKNVKLAFKINCTTKRTIKERVYEILKGYYSTSKNIEIKLPFNKNQLADFLAVNRSSLSRELSKMETEGFFKYKDKIYILNKKFF